VVVVGEVVVVVVGVVLPFCGGSFFFLSWFGWVFVFTDSVVRCKWN